MNNEDTIRVLKIYRKLIKKCKRKMFQKFAVFFIDCKFSFFQISRDKVRCMVHTVRSLVHGGLIERPWTWWFPKRISQCLQVPKGPVRPSGKRPKRQDLVRIANFLCLKIWKFWEILNWIFFWVEEAPLNLSTKPSDLSLSSSNSVTSSTGSTYGSTLNLNAGGRKNEIWSPGSVCEREARETTSVIRSSPSPSSMVPAKKVCHRASTSPLTPPSAERTFQVGKKDILKKQRNI